MSLTKKTFGGFLWLGGVKASNAIFQFAILAILARLLTPTEFGLMGLALLVTSFADIFNDMGFGPAITQKKDLTKTDIYTGFTYSLIFGVILFLLLQIFAPLIASFFKNDELTGILRVISIVLLLKSAITTPMGLMYRDMQFKKLSLIEIASYVLGYGGVGIMLAYLGFGVWSLVIAVLARSLLSFLLYLFMSKSSLGFSLNNKSFKELIHFGGGYSLSKIFSYGANQGDKIVVGRILGVDALGLYERGFQLVKYASNLLGEIIDKVLFSPIARKQDNRKLIGEIYLELTYILTLLFFPFSAFMYSYAKPIVRVILGTQWDSSIPIVQIMSFSIFFLITTRIGSTIAKSLGDVYRRAWRTLIYGVYVIIAVYVGSSWGVEGAAIAVSIGTAINYLLAYVQVQDLTNVKHLTFFKNHVLGLLLGVMYIVGNYLTKNFLIGIIDNPLLDILFGIGLLVLVYFIALLLDNKKLFKKYNNIIFKKKYE